MPVKFDPALIDKPRITPQSNSKSWYELSTPFSYKSVTSTEARDLQDFDSSRSNLLDIQNELARTQPAFEQGVNIVRRAVATFSSAALEGLAVPASLPYAGIKSLSGESFSDSLFRNALVRGIEGIKEQVFEDAPVYLTPEQREDKNLMDYLTTPNKVFDDLGQGIGFLAAQIIPTNWVASGFTKTGKLSKWFEEAQLAKSGLKNFGKLDDAAKAKLVEQGIDPIQFEAKLANTQKLLEKVGVLTGATVGRLGESAMEANQSYDEIYKKLSEQGYSEEEASNIARQESNKVFGLNMALAIPDALEFMTVYKGMTGLKNLLGSGANKIDDAAKLITKGEKGFTVTPLSNTKKIANKLWKISKTSALESEEEGLQSTFQLAAMENALDIASGSEVDGYLNEVLNQYTKSWTTIEGQKARALGAILGGGATAISSFGENRATEQLATKLVGDDTYTEEQADQLSLNQQVLQSDKIDPEKRFTILEDGTVKINEQYLRTLNNYTNIEEKKAIAQLIGDKVSYDRLSDLQLINQTVAYAQAGKIDDLINKYEYLATAKKEEVEEFIGQKLVDDLGNPIEPKQFMDNKINRIKQINKLFDDISNDPTLGTLSNDSKRVIAYKLAIFDNNKSEINKLNTSLGILKAKNGEAIANSYLTEVEDTSNFSDAQKKELEANKENKWRGLNGIEQEKAVKLENSLKELNEENKEILTWYSNTRQDVKDFEQKVNEVQQTKDVEKTGNKIQEKADEAANAILTPEQKAIKARKTQLENKLNVKLGRVEKGKTYISNLQETLLNLEIEAEQLVNDNTGKKLSTKQLNKLNKALVELENQIQEVENKITEAEKLLTDLYNEISDLNNALSQEVLPEGYTIEALQSDLEIKKKEHDWLTRQLSNDYSLLGNLKALYNKLKNIWTRLYPNKKENLAKGRYKYVEAKEELNVSKEDIKNLQDAINEAEQVKSKIENEIKLLEQEIDEYNRILGEETIEKKQQTTVQKATNNSQNINNPETQEVTKDDVEAFDEYSKKLIDVVGFGTTYGSFFDYKFDDNKTPNSDITQRRWFSFTENMNPTEQYRLMIVSVNHPVYGFGKSESIYTENDPENIKCIVCDVNGEPIFYLGNLVHTSLALTKETDTKGIDRFAFSDKELSEEEKVAVLEAAKKQHTEFRNKILNNSDKTFYLDVKGVSHGITQTELLSQSVIGRLVQSKEDLANIQIKIVKSKDKKGKVETPDGQSVSVSNGLPYVIYKNRIVPLITRKLNTQEITTALELTKAYVENYKDNKNKIQGVDRSITSILEDFVYMSNKDSEFKFYLNKDSLQFGTKTITKDELLSGQFDEEIKQFLATKTHQVNSSRLQVQGNYTHYYVSLKETGRSLKKQIYKNYTEYLFTAPNEYDNAPLSTNLKQNFIDNDALNNEEKLQNLQFANSYIIFDNTPEALSTIKRKVVEKEPIEDTNETFELTFDKISFLPDNTTIQYDATPSLSFIFKKEGNSIKDVKVIKNDKNYQDSVIDAFFSKEVFDSKAKLTGTFKVISEPKVTSESVEEVIEMISKEDKDTKLDEEQFKKDADEFDKFFTNDSGVNLFQEDEEINRFIKENENPLSEEEVNKVKAILPKEVNYLTVKGLIDSKTIGRVLENGTILLSDLATEGTAYHEAYHIVSLFILSNKERLALYEQYKKRTGKKDLTNKQVEEELAEDFRSYMLSDGTVKLPKEEKTLFQKIVDFIKALLGMPNTSIEEVFNKISSGQYVNNKLNLYKLKEAFNRDANVDLNNPNDLKELMEGMTYSFFDVLFKNKSTLDDLFTGKIKPLDIYKAVYATYKQQANTSIGKAYISSSLPLFAEAMQKHMEYLNSFGIKIYNVNDKQDENTPYEDLINENDKSKDSLGIDLAIESSTKDTIPKLAKYLIVSLKAYKKKTNPTDNNVPVINSIGMPTVVDFDNTLNYLQNKLAGQTTYKGMIDVIEQLSILNPTYSDLLNKLKSTSLILTPMSLTSSQVDLQTAFFKQFSKTKHTYVTTVFDEKKGTILFVDSNKQQLRDRIKNKWQANLKANLFSKYIKNVDGVLYLNTDELVKNFPDKFTNNLDGKVKFLRAVGINLINASKINWADVGFSELKEHILKSKNATDIFNEKIDIQSRLNKLVDSQIEATDEIPELQHINQEGKTVYSITLNNFLSLIVNKLNEGTIPEFLQPINNEGEVINSYTVNSKILEEIKNGSSINIEILEGIDYEGDGKATAESTQGDRLIQSFNAILHGKYPIIRTSDKKQEFSLSVVKNDKPVFLLNGKGKSYEEILTEAVSQLKLYLSDELNTINESQANYQYYKTNNTKLSIFDNIINKDNHAKLIDGLLTVDDVEGDIRNYITEQISKNLFTLQKYNIVNKVEGKGYKFDSLLAEITERLSGSKSEILTEENTNKLMAIFTANSLIGNIEQSKLFFGNFASYKNLTDLFKRTSGIIGTKVTPRVDSDINNWLNENFKRSDNKVQDGTLRSIVCTDPIAIEELDSYKDGYEEPDAQGYITLDEYREFLKRTNDWTTEQEELYQNIVNDKPLNKKNNALFNPLKPQYFGNQINNIGFVPTFYKLSLYPIHPKLLPVGAKLSDLYSKMTDKQIGIMLFATGNKVGRKINNQNKGQEFYTENGEIADLQDEFIQTIDYNYFGIQVENKGYKNKVITGSQVRAIVQSNLFSEGKAISPKAETLANELDDVFNKLTELSKKELLKELSIEEINNGLDYKVTNVDKFRKFLIDESKSRQVPDNIIVGLQQVLNEANTNKYFEVLVNKNKIENLLFSLINNNIIRQKTFGNMAVQVASTGFETKGRTQENDVWAKSQDSLKFYRNENGKIARMEVFLPHYFKDYFGDIDITKIDQRLLQVIGFRIPTEQLNSIDAIVVKGFLPKESGNVVVVPSGIVKKSGSDFDIDKLSLFFPNYTINKPSFKETIYYTSLSPKYQEVLNKLSKQEFNSFINDLNKYSVSTGKGEKGDLSESEEYQSWSKEQQDMADEVKLNLIKYNESIKKNKDNELQYVEYNKNNPTKEGLQNRMIELFSDILLMPENFNSLIEPNSIEELQILKNKISGTVKETSFTKAIEWSYISDIADQYWKGKALVGVFALQNKHHILTQKTNLSVNTDIYFKGFQDKQTHSLGRINAINENGNSTKEVISKTNGQLVSTVVDVAKNPDVLTGLNINFDTATTISYLIRLGIPKDTVFYFINQPIIKQYLDEIEKLSKAKFLKVSDKNVTVTKIKKKYLQNYNGENKYISLDELKDNIDKVVNLNNQFQLQTLNNFLKYKEQAQKLSDVITAFNQDTLGAGKNRNELKLIVQKIDDVLLNKDGFFNNIDNLIENTFLKEFYETVLDTQKFYKDLFLTDKPKFKAVLDDIVKELTDRNDLVQDDIVKLLDIAEADLVTYALQSVFNKDKEKINTEINKLFKGKDSLPRRFIEFVKANPNSLLAKEFVPIFNRESGIDNLKLFTKRLNYWESNNITNALSDLKGINPSLYNDLIKFSILQSGLNQSPISFTQVIPNEDFVKLSSELLTAADKFDIPLQNFKEQFYKNNWNNSKLIPKEPAFKQDRNSGQYYAQNKDYIFVPLYKGNLPYVKININVGNKENPKWETWVYERTQPEEGKTTVKYLRTNKFGDGMYLKEFGLSSSNIVNNNYMFVDKTVIKETLPELQKTEIDFNDTSQEAFDECNPPA